MILIITLIGRILGFIRGVFISEEFGLGMETDAFFAAFVIPMTLLMIIPGAIHSVFIPELSKAKQISEERAVHLYQKVLTITVILGAISSILGYFLANPLSTILAPGFDEPARLLTADLLMWMIPSIFFIGFIGVVSAVLYVEKKFFMPSFGPTINSLVVIASIFMIVPIMGIEGLALGTLLGFIGYSIVMIPTLLRSNYPLSLRGSWASDNNLRSMGIRFIPVLIGSFVSQLNIYVERFLASGLGDAKVSALALSYTLIQAPTALFAGAFIVPLFPLFSEYYSKNKMNEIKDLVIKGLSYLFIILIPIMAVFIALNEEIIRFVFERGQFDAEDTKLTAWALLFYSMAILAIASRQLIIRVYYAMEDTKTPVLLGLLSFVLYLSFSPFLISRFDHGGIALSVALSDYIGTALLTWKVRKRIGNIFNRPFLITTFKVIAATVLMVIVIRGDIMFQSGWLLGFAEQLPVLLGVPLLLMMSVIFYILFLLIFKESLLYELVGKVKRKVKSNS